MSVQSSTFMAMFQSTNQAVWIKTNEGVVEAVFFPTSAEVEQIHITGHTNEVDQRFRYTIQALPPILLSDQTIDSEFPLYFTTNKNILMITSSEELDKTLKKIFPGQ